MDHQILVAKTAHWSDVMVHGLSYQTTITCITLSSITSEANGLHCTISIAHYKHWGASLISYACGFCLFIMLEHMHMSSK